MVQRLQFWQRRKCTNERILTCVRRILRITQQSVSVKESSPFILDHQRFEPSGVAVFQAELNGFLFVHT